MIAFKLFAGTNIGLRDNNEDNFIVCPDLSIGEWMVPANQQDTIPLGKRGCLIVVADGMGGMNAGEVASDIAVKTVQKMFAPSALPADVLEKSDSIQEYLKKVIKESDIQVKKFARENPTTEGMGSTIILAWLYGNNIYIGWLGDSRAYSYIPKLGIRRLSKDHSYVQQLIDAKMLTEEQAMVHPESNIITRSLGDTSQKAKPDVVVHPVVEGEIILLCSDGLCGVCPDIEIAHILDQKSIDLPKCKDVLTEAALERGGSDNITVALLQITNKSNDPNIGVEEKKSIWNRKKYIFILLCCLAVIAIGGILTLLDCFKGANKWPVENISLIIKSDTLYHKSDTLHYGETIYFEVVVSPSEACQEFLLNYPEKYVFVDTISKTITMTKNKSGKASIIAISRCDSLKCDTLNLILQKKNEDAILVEEAPLAKERISISFSIFPKGPLEAGKIYDFSIDIKPDIVASGGYEITCNEPGVIIDPTNHKISVPNNLSNSGVCQFVVTPKLKRSKSKSFESSLKGSQITHSKEEMTNINVIKN